MGSFIELNDTLQITIEQGFPDELTLEGHLQSPFKAEDFVDRVFTFKDKSKIRVYQQPPVRVFWVQNIDGKWLYWGQVEILTIQHDYVNQLTSGTYRVTKIFSPDEMRWAEETIHSDKSFAYFATHL